ncbi:hypothetical protein EF847_10175 [Actinobacteria bacterium YIM 96077]|uniref:Uncharacterized protein n=1 Tax=Phytoactinopolyspora halophila TaxID=1981511 RepID=A0A329QRD9_9ACTN|nr:hypothetical protein EF847_10175 [Actinobacteria bacterium YIM 96077]RAW13278.1 hypothetical protein DPM12_13200 [Phytoactinopolyspora halophila]
MPMALVISTAAGKESIDHPPRAHVEHDGTEDTTLAGWGSVWAGQWPLSQLLGVDFRWSPPEPDKPI